MGKRLNIKDHPDAEIVRRRVLDQINLVDGDDFKQLVRDTPSLRSFVLGYVAELLFERHICERHPELLDVRRHDDHAREFNKSDRSIHHERRIYRVQVKSIQTASVCWRVDRNRLEADVQNDGSDKRNVTLPSGAVVSMTGYRRGDYDLLAVPLYPFTGNIEFAYKRNRDCRSTTSSKYSKDDQPYILATTEKISWPLDDGWTSNLSSLLDPTIGLCLDEAEVAELEQQSAAELIAKTKAPVAIPRN